MDREGGICEFLKFIPRIEYGLLSLALPTKSILVPNTYLGIYFQSISIYKWT